MPEPKIEVRGPRTNLEKLIKPTKHHPKGRVQVENGEVVGPKNNVVGTREKVIRHESGVEIARVEFPIHGGHVKAMGSVWRVGLAGPAKYHKRVLEDKKRAELKQSTDKTAIPLTDLTDEEATEYKEYLAFLKEANQEWSENEPFYAWLKKGKKKAE